MFPNLFASTTTTEMITSWLAKQPKNIQIQQVQHVPPVTRCWPNRWYHAMEIEAHEVPCPWRTGWCREFHRLFFETTLARRAMEETSGILVVYMRKAKNLLFKWNVSIFVTQQDPGATSSYLDHYTLPKTYSTSQKASKIDIKKTCFPHILFLMFSGVILLLKGYLATTMSETWHWHRFLPKLPWHLALDPSLTPPWPILEAVVQWPVPQWPGASSQRWWPWGNIDPLGS